MKKLLSIHDLLIIHAILEITFGLMIIFAPETLLILVGSTLTEPEGILFARLFGVAAMCIGLTGWLFRNTNSAEVKHKIVGILQMFQILMTVMLVVNQLYGTRNSWGWLIAAMHGIIAIAFTSLYFLEPNHRTK